VTQKELNNGKKWPKQLRKEKKNNLVEDLLGVNFAIGKSIEPLDSGVCRREATEGGLRARVGQINPEGEPGNWGAK